MTLLLVSTSYDFQQIDDTICWSNEYKLQWSDFKGPADTTSIGKAGCAATIEAKGFWDGKPNYTVTNCFEMNISWTVDTSSIILLGHEQLHFDIAEIHARLIRKGVDSLRSNGVKEIAPYSQLIQGLLRERNMMDSLYDKETDHSVNIKKQNQWESRAEVRLEKLSGYEL